MKRHLEPLPDIPRHRDHRPLLVWQRINVCAFLLLPLASLAPCTSPSVAQADEIRLSVPVAVLNAPAPEPQMDAMAVQREATPQATPGARMPQYQLHRLDRGVDADANSADLRFILVLPDRPVLVDATIRIDGMPFRQLRENRVQEILRYVEDPEAFKAAALAAAATEAQREAEAAPVDAGLLQTVISIFNEVTAAEEPAESPQLPADSQPISGSNSDLPDSELRPESPGAATPSNDDVSQENPDVETPAEEGTAAEATPVVRAVPKYMAPVTIFERIDRYMTSTGQAPAADEIRWLLTNWVDGPVLLFLNDNFQRFRADQQPVFNVLDRNRDGRISAEELTQAVSSFQECDLDRNDVVEATELAEVADDPRDEATHAGAGALICRLPDDASAITTLRRLAARYAALPDSQSALSRIDADGDGLLNSDELQMLSEGSADIHVLVEFSTTMPDSSRLTVDGFAPDFMAQEDSAIVNRSSVTLKLSNCDLELLAVQGAASDQISVGAVNDGYAMLPELDPNGDGRFSIRELRQLNDRLKVFDRNNDEEIASDEIHPTYRVCIGLGPTAHQPLALLRTANALAAVSGPDVPEWFQEMDKNRDDDLSRREFPGTDEQFRQLDIDSDELVSAAEAIDSEK